MIRSRRYKVIIGVAFLLALISSAFPTLQVLHGTPGISFVELSWTIIGVLGVYELIGTLRHVRQERADNLVIKGPPTPITVGIGIWTKGHVLRTWVRLTGQCAFIVAAAIAWVPIPDRLSRSITLLMLHYGQLSWLINSASEAEDAETIADLNR